MASETEVSDTVENVLALINLDRLESVRMSADYDVSTVTDESTSSFDLALSRLVFCFDAPVARNDNDLASLCPELLDKIILQ